MKIRAIVYTTDDAPRTPRLEDAWDETTAAVNPEGVRHDLADVLMQTDTHRAVVVTIDVPDAALLARLDLAEPTVPGTLT